jgi:hypothetical protein
MQVKDQLNKAKTAASVTPLEAREAMLSCFVTIHGETLKRGAMLLGEKLTDEETERQARASMRSVMGTDFEKPTAASLTAAKVRLDQKMNFSKAPQDLRDMHDQVCSMILRKVV